MRRALSLLLLAAPLWSAACGSGEDGAWRAIWVTRWDYRSADDVRRVVADCAGAGFRQVLFQVRGNATVFYRSSLEPWADELGGADPGYDPLEVACDAARREGIELHAWINVMPAWWGSTPPADPAQLYNARPEWFWYDQRGERAPLVPEFYASLNPCLPSVRRYLAEVAAEIARYPVHGVHLDYLRFPNEAPVVPSGSDVDYPRDPATLGLYRAATGLRPDDDPAAWTSWRCDQVTATLVAMRDAVRRERPEAVLSAAVGPTPPLSRAHFQDTLAWLEAGLLDVVVPMNYASDMDVFLARLAPWEEVARAVSPVRVVPGVRADGGELAVRRAQLEEVERRFGGHALFGYGALFESPDDAEPEARAERRASLLPLVRGDWR